MGIAEDRAYLRWIKHSVLVRLAIRAPSTELWAQCPREQNVQSPPLSKDPYAENVEEMLDRMKFDLIYLKNRTLSLDFKIMLFTISIIFKGTGK